MAKVLSRPFSSTSPYPDTNPKPTKSRKRIGKTNYTRVFEPLWGDGECTFHLNEGISREDRKAFCMNVPAVLDEQRLLTQRELDENQLTELQPDKIYWYKTPSGRRPALVRLSAQWLQNHNLLDRLVALRARMLSAPVANVFTHGRTGGSRPRSYPMSFTVQPTYNPNSINLAPKIREPGILDPRSLMTELTELIAKATELALADVPDAGRERRWWQEASMTMGSRANHHYTSVALNYTLEDKDVVQSLGPAAGVHHDMGNDPTSFASLTGMSNHTADYFTGRFNVRCLSATVPLLPLEIILFSASFYHCSTGGGRYTVPRDSPLRVMPYPKSFIPDLPADTEHMRLNIVLYADTRLMRPHFRSLSPRIYTRTAEACFENKLHHHEWMMRLYIVKELELRGRLGTAASFEPGSGPKQLNMANFRSSKGAEVLADSVRYGNKLVRNGDPDVYTKLFGFTDTMSGRKVRPDRQMAIRTLEVLGEENREFERLQSDMKYLLSNRGDNHRSSKRPKPQEITGSEDRLDDSEDTIETTESDEQVPSDTSNVDSFPVLESPSESGAISPAMKEFQDAIAVLVVAAMELFAVDAQANIAELLKPLTQPVISRDKDNERPSEHRSAGLKSLHKAVESARHDEPTKHSSEPLNTRALSHVGKRKHDSSASDQPARDSLKSRSHVGKGIIELHADPVIVDDEEEYEVEAVVGKRPRKSGSPLYRVRWQGYTADWDEWVSCDQLHHCQDLIDEYEDKWVVV